jgi:hypothetical protein
VLMEASAARAFQVALQDWGKRLTRLGQSWKPPPPPPGPLSRRPTTPPGGPRTQSRGGGGPPEMKGADPPRSMPRQQQGPVWGPAGNLSILANQRLVAVAEEKFLRVAIADGAMRRACRDALGKSNLGLSSRAYQVGWALVAGEPRPCGRSGDAGRGLERKAILVVSFMR